MGLDCLVLLGGKDDEMRMENGDRERWGWLDGRRVQ